MICLPCREAADNPRDKWQLHDMCPGLHIHKTFCDCQHKLVEISSDKSSQKDGESSTGSSPSI